MTLTATTTHWPTASKTGSSDRHHPSEPSGKEQSVTGMKEPRIPA